FWLKDKAGLAKAMHDGDHFAEAAEALADVLAILAEEFGGEAPDAATVEQALRDLDGDHDPHAGAAVALIDHAIAAAEAGEDVQPGLDRIVDLLDSQGGGEEVEKAFDSAKHPRDDAGRFVSRDAIADAKGDPAKEEELRKRVTDPAERKKLDAALGGDTDLGRTKRGQARADAAERRQTRQASKEKATEVLRRIRANGEVTADDVRDLADHLPAMTVAELRLHREALMAKLGGKRVKDQYVRSLVEHARGKAEDGGAGGSVEPARGSLFDDDRPPQHAAQELAGMAAIVLGRYVGDPSTPGRAVAVLEEVEAYANRLAGNDGNAETLVLSGARSLADYAAKNPDEAAVVAEEIRDMKDGPEAKELDALARKLRDAGHPELASFMVRHFPRVFDAVADGILEQSQAKVPDSPPPPAPAAAGPAPTPDAPPPAKPAGEPAAQSSVSLTDHRALADAVAAAGHGLPDWRGKRRGESWDRAPHKVVIADLYDAVRDRLGGATLAEFKDALLRAARAGAVTLEPVDMVQYAASPERVGQSRTSHGAAVSIPAPPPTPEPPAAPPAATAEKPGVAPADVARAATGRAATPEHVRGRAAQFAADPGGKRRLASLYVHAHRIGGGELARHAAEQFAAHGLEEFAAEGDVVPFDGAVHEAAVGVSTGQPVRVTRPGVGDTAEDRAHAARVVHR
ncbi:MAG TPA: hypothetical protein VM529_19220, partial [Gemmata sp.]|nr:hypothetical protein [Gemmata sp.]